MRVLFTVKGLLYTIVEKHKNTPLKNDTNGSLGKFYGDSSGHTHF